MDPDLRSHGSFSLSRISYEGNRLDQDGQEFTHSPEDNLGCVHFQFDIFHCRIWFQYLGRRRYTGLGKVHRH